MFNLASKNKPRLWLELNIYGDRHVYPDFDRFNYEFVPRLTDKHLAKRLDREHQVFKWYSTFKVNNEYAETTLHSLYRGLCEYVRACDHARVDPESKNGVECWEKYLVHRVRTNQESANSARGKLSQIKTCVFRSIRTAIPASFGQAFRCRPDKLILTSHDFLFT